MLLQSLAVPPFNQKSTRIYNRIPLQYLRQAMLRRRASITFLQTCSSLPPHPPDVGGLFTNPPAHGQVPDVEAQPDVGAKHGIGVQPDGGASLCPPHGGFTSPP